MTSMAVDRYVLENRFALVAIDMSDGNPKGHCVDHRSVAALARRGLVYELRNGGLRLTPAGHAALDEMGLS